MHEHGRPVWVLWVFGVATLAGFANAVYLTIAHFTATTVPCYIGTCEKVLTSSYSVLGGIPIAVYGVVYFLTVLVLLAWYVESHTAVALRLAALATPLGVLASVYFFYLQAWVIQAWCQYCLFSAAVSVVMFVCASIILFHRNTAGSVV